MFCLVFQRCLFRIGDSLKNADDRNGHQGAIFLNIFRGSERRIYESNRFPVLATSVVHQKRCTYSTRIASQPNSCDANMQALPNLLVLV
jgi:hypothetical protein